MFFDIKKGGKLIWAHHVSDWAPKKFPACPIRSQKWAPKEPIPSFGVGQRTTASWSFYISLFVCLGISTSLFSLSLSVNTDSDISTNLCASLRMWSHQCMRWFKFSHQESEFCSLCQRVASDTLAATVAPSSDRTEDHNQQQN